MNLSPQTQRELVEALSCLSEAVYQVFCRLPDSEDEMDFVANNQISQNLQKFDEWLAKARSEMGGDDA